MSPPTSRESKKKQSDQSAIERVSAKQIAKNAVRGGPKSEKKNKRPAGSAQKG
jgi:hypothetical protein